MGATRTKRDTSGTPVGRTRSDTNAGTRRRKGHGLSVGDRECAGRPAEYVCWAAAQCGGGAGPRAQAYLGFMYQNGRGVPQSFEEGARFYRASAEQGFPPAQYMLGLMYDKGQGVPQDYVLAYMWVTLGVAGAAPKERPAWTRVRDAIATKMSLAQRSLGQRLALGKPTLRVPNSWPWPW